jgi:hypothetical protein
VDNLPSSITHLIFDKYFDQSLNNLPRFTEFIKLPENYNNKIFNIPKRLKTIECYEKYEYLNDFVDLEITHI